MALKLHSDTSVFLVGRVNKDADTRVLTEIDRARKRLPCSRVQRLRKPSIACVPNTRHRIVRTPSRAILGGFSILHELPRTSIVLVTRENGNVGCNSSFRLRSLACFVNSRPAKRGFSVEMFISLRKVMISTPLRTYHAITKAACVQITFR